MNTHHPSITVKAELSSESMHFLDTVIYKGNRFKETGTFDTKVDFKPTDTLELLHKKSHHPNHTFKGLIKSQILRYVRICNNKQHVMIACRKLFAALVRRGYSERFLRKIKDKTLCELRKRDLYQRCPTRNCELCSTQVVVESGKTMGGVQDAGNQIQIPTTQNCDSTNSIYCIVCSKCKKLYVGETGLSFRKRINIHRSFVRLKWLEHFSLAYLPWFRCKWVGLPGRTNIAMITISSKGRNGCMTWWLYDPIGSVLDLGTPGFEYCVWGTIASDSQLMIASQEVCRHWIIKRLPV